MSCAGCDHCSFTEQFPQDFDPSNLPYELHITVSASSDIEKFKNDCSELGVKPILIDLQRKDGASMLDLMTSSTIKGTFSKAHNTLIRKSAQLELMGYEVLRRKIETVPWHPEAEHLKDGQYFECHMAVKSHLRDLGRLSRVAKGSGAHLSRNAFKSLPGDYSITMLTLRDRSSLTKFLRKKLILAVALRQDGFDVEKTITEFAIYDDKIDHDKNWISLK